MPELAVFYTAPVCCQYPKFSLTSSTSAAGMFKGLPKWIDMTWQSRSRLAQSKQCFCSFAQGVFRPRRAQFCGAATFRALCTAPSKLGANLFSPMTKIKRSGPKQVAATRLPPASILTSSPFSERALAEVRNTGAEKAARRSSWRFQCQNTRLWVLSRS